MNIRILYAQGAPEGERPHTCIYVHAHMKQDLIG